MKKEEVKDTTSKAGLVISEYPLNVRKEKSIESEILKVLDPGVQVTVNSFRNNEQTDDFVEVILEDGLKGYCLKEYLKLILN